MQHTTTTWPLTQGPVRVEVLDRGRLWRIRLATPRANVLDLEKILTLHMIFERAAEERSLCAVLIEGDGPNFSFGASVEEHMPGRVGELLPAFHGLFARMLRAAVPCLAAVRGQCLGGGLELAAFCHRVFAAPDAKLGQPEIQLGVFAPVASALLADRIGRGRAEDLCLSGRSMTAGEALSIGLVDEVAEDPAAAAMGYAREHLLRRSASSLRMAVRAARHGFARRFERDLEALERIYLDELMATHDAVEGIASFMEKRAPVWSDS